MLRQVATGLYRGSSRRAAALRSQAMYRGFLNSAPRQSHQQSLCVGASSSSRRLLTSSSKTPTTGRSMDAIASRASKNADKGQEAIEKAERLHAEINEMIASQKARRIEELSQPFGSGFLSFVKGAKSEMINIFFAFVCVLLAYQIYGTRAGIRKLLAEREEKDEEIYRLRGILAELSKGHEGGKDGGDGAGAEEAEEVEDDTFSSTLARKCAAVVKGMFAESESRAGYSWILGKKLAGGDNLESDRLVDEMIPVILREVRSAVGDAAFTPEERKERHVQDLKMEMKESSQAHPTELSSSETSYPAGGRKDAQRMGDLMEILEEVHNKDLTDERNRKNGDDENATTTKVRRTRYAI